MKISILTLFPALMNACFSESIIKRAIEKKIVDIQIINLRDYAIDAYGSVDDRPYGGGAGMVMRVDVVDTALSQLKVQPWPRLWPASQSRIILTSPRGRTFNQGIAQSYASELKHLTIICGHYEGFDERVSDLVDEEISLGDFVMTGGEIAAAAIVDSVTRLLNGTIQEKSPTEESFFTVSVDTLKSIVSAQDLKALQDKNVTTVQLLEYPHYTRPEEYNGKKVPEVLLSGHHKEIEKWRLKTAYEITKTRRPDLLKI